jgi:hypothetical protein
MILLPPTTMWQRVQGAISSGVPVVLPQGMRPTAETVSGRVVKRREKKRKREKRRGIWVLVLSNEHFSLKE